MTKQELLSILADLPEDVHICGFNSECGSEYDPVTAVFVPKGGLVTKERRTHWAGTHYVDRHKVTTYHDVHSPNNVLVLTEMGEAPTDIAECGITVWSKE
jgi:hypothetical protein